MSDSSPYCKKLVVDPEKKVSCGNCHSSYHAACSVRHATSTVGVFKCCSNKLVDDSSLTDGSLASGNLLSQRTRSNSHKDKESDKISNKDNTELLSEIKKLFHVKFKKVQSNIESVQKTLKSVENKVNRVEAKITSLEHKVSMNATNISELFVSTNSHSSEISEVKSSLETLANVLSTSQSNHSVDEIYSELSERQSRSKNLIMYNLTEQVADTPNYPNADPPNYPNADLTRACQLMSEIRDIDIDAIAVRRIGKFSPDKIRPLIVTLASAKEMHIALAHKNVLPQEISISADLTPTQQSQLKTLKEEVSKHNIENPDNKKTIRFHNNIPKIVNSKSKN